MIDVIYPPNSILPESNYEGQKRHAHARLRSPHKTPFLLFSFCLPFTPDQPHRILTFDQSSG